LNKEADRTILQFSFGSRYCSLPISLRTITGVWRIKCKKENIGVKVNQTISM